MNDCRTDICLSNVLIGGCVGGVVGVLLSSWWLVVLVLVLVFGVLSVLVGSVNRVLLVLLVSLVVCSWFMRLGIDLFGVGSVVFNVFLLGWLFVFAGLVLVSRRWWVSRSWVDSVQAGVVTLSVLVLWFVVSVPARSNPLFYAFFMGEDNGSVFDVSAQFLQGGSFTPATFYNGGWLTGVLQSLSSFVSTRGVSNPTGALEVIDAVTRTYVLFGALSSVVAALKVAGAVATRVTSLVWRFVWAGVGVVVSLPWVMGTIQYGHLAALIAILCLQVLLVVAQYRVDESVSGERFVHSVILVVLALSLGGAWYPLVPFSLAVIGGLLVNLLLPRLNKWREQPLGSTTLAVCCLCVGALLLSAYFSDFYRELTDRGSVFSIIQYGGGVTGIGQPLLLAVLAGAIWLAVRALSSSVRWVVYALVSYVMVLNSVSYFLGGSPMYGAAKTALIVVGALCPVVVAAVVVRFGGVLVPSRLVAAVLLVVLCVFVVSVEPFSSFATVSSNRPQEGEYRGLEKVLSEPDRVTVCLSTGDDNRDYEMYKCSRVLLGAQGLHDSSLNVFMGGNLCSVNSAAMYAIPRETLENLRIVVSNPGRLSVGEGCGRRGWAGANLEDDLRYLLGWTSAIPYGKVEIVDEAGNQIVPSFEYLNGDGAYEEQEIAALEATLSNS